MNLSSIDSEMVYAIISWVVRVAYLITLFVCLWLQWWRDIPLFTVYLAGNNIHAVCGGLGAATAPNGDVALGCLLVFAVVEALWKVVCFDRINWGLILTAILIGLGLAIHEAITTPYVHQFVVSVAVRAFDVGVSLVAVAYIAVMWNWCRPWTRWHVLGWCAFAWSFFVPLRIPYRWEWEYYWIGSVACIGALIAVILWLMPFFHVLRVHRAVLVAARVGNHSHGTGMSFHRTRLPGYR